MFLKVLKPLHGWRAFIGEVAIIVIGVGIALVAQQLVENWNWQGQVAHADEQLIGESRDNFNYAAEEVTAQPCLNVQLDRMLAAVTAPGDRLTPLPPIASVFGPVALRRPSRAWRSDIWNSVLSDGIAAHLPDDRRQLFANLYAQLANERMLAEQATALNSRLNLMLNPVALDLTLRARLLEEIAEQRAIQNHLALVGVQMMGTMWALGQAPSASSVDQYLAQSGTIKYCRSKGLPLANWRTQLTAQRASAIADGDPEAAYIARHR